MSKKDFDGWNEVKKKLESLQADFPYPKKREIWWCVFGVNIGTEQDGNAVSFERPALVLKKINRTMFRVAPITSDIKIDKHHVPIAFEGKTNSLIISQIKSVRIKRLTVKISRIDQTDFDSIREIIRKRL